MPFVFQASDYPERPGCYIMKNEAGRILYVGKSKSLRSRLRSYFKQNHPEKRIRQLVTEIASIEIMLVNNESESLMLENNLIKIHKPPFNRALKKDNSGYAYLQLTKEKVPRLTVCYRDRRLPAERQPRAAEPAGREAPGPAEAGSAGEGGTAARGSRRAGKPALQGAEAAAAAVELAAARRETAAGRAPEPEQRFGPYLSSRFRDAVLEFVADHYRLRTCERMPKRVCLLYHIGRCSGVCEGMISVEEYRETARQAAALLVHHGDDLIAAMYGKMEWYSARLQFEKAANMLRHIRVLERMPAKQIVDREGSLNQDVLYFGEERVLVAQVQEGMLRDFDLLPLDTGAGDASCDRFLVARYYAERPDELIVNRIHDPRGVSAALRKAGGRPVRITQPKRGLKYDLLQLCRENYEYRIRLEQKGEAGR